MYIGPTYIIVVGVIMAIVVLIISAIIIVICKIRGKFVEYASTLYVGLTRKHNGRPID